LLIVGCQICGEVKILSGMPDKDGIARVNWTCPYCGVGQVLQLPVASDVTKTDLSKIVAGMPDCYRGSRSVFEELQ